jgi:hypothetical protein
VCSLEGRKGLGSTAPKSLLGYRAANEGETLHRGRWLYGEIDEKIRFRKWTGGRSVTPGRSIVIKFSRNKDRHLAIGSAELVVPVIL